MRWRRQLIRICDCPRVVRHINASQLPDRRAVSSILPMVHGRRPSSFRLLTHFIVAITIASVTTGCNFPLTGFGPEPPEIETTESEWVYGRSTGRKIASPNYVLYTTCKRESFVRALPTFLERCFEAYQDLLPTANPPSEPLDTYLFCERSDWERFTKEFSPARFATYKRIRRGGYSERGITVSHYSSQRGTLSILAHEGLHQYLEVTGRGRIPAWINEGLACYFESFDLDSGQPRFNPRRNTLRSPFLREALVRDQLIPLRDILETNAGAAVHGNTSHVRSYYAQEWSLVLYLLDDSAPDQYRSGFRSLLNDLGSDNLRTRAESVMSAASVSGQKSVSPGEAVFRAYITDDIGQFDADYRDFLADLLGLNG